ncbi:hypothetical protein I8H83_00930 [Candidatus Saccharibacteria bacterium]|nr:hypothetical protein [Candidatus Saccharibacteria bacterium]MBH2007150.1 hypothetical protein [Candidatus Saccharibacteria bacterium]
MNIAKQIIGIPFLLARKLVADPIYALDQVFGAGMPVRRPIKDEIFIGDNLDKTDAKTRVEQAIIDLVTDPTVGRQVNKSLELHGHVEIVVILADADAHPSLELKMDYLQKQITERYESPVGIRVDVLRQGTASSDKPECIVIAIDKT